VTTAAARLPLCRERIAMLSGVCGGLAFHLGWRVRVVRIGFVLLALMGGAGILLYAWLWALVPIAGPTEAAPAITHRVPVAIISISIAALIAVGALEFSSEDALAGWLLVVTVFVAVAVSWTLLFDRFDPARSRLQGFGVRAAAVALLVVGGIITLLSRPSVMGAVTAVIMLALGLGVLIAPLFVQLWTDLLTQRAARARQEQRAEIAAHLHDSVLQSLALIQNRAEASSEVARIARAQERELRDWLFIGDAAVANDLAAELASVAAGIELDYPVRIEIVSAGRSVPGHRSLIAAAREAMMNAARHAGGTVSVYLETTDSAIDVFVRDRGPGIDLEALPSDRLGIRESIIGRMARADGSATVRPTASGTEVHLHLSMGASE
jgi:signal transduction histidine kinase